MPLALRTAALAAALLLLLLQPVLAQGSTDPEALVASVKGPARVLVLPPGGGKLKDAKATPVKSLDSLQAGTFLQLGSGATATLAYHADGHREDLTGPCVVQVTPHGSHLVKGDPGAIQHSESEAAEALAPDGPVARVQVTSGTTLTVTQKYGMPTFSWKTDAAGPYLVSVYNPGPPRNNLWSSEAAGTSVGYDGPILTPAIPYVVQLEAAGQPVGALRFQIESDASVRSLGAAQAEVQAAPQDAAGHAMLAVSRDQRGDLSGAVQSMQSALDQQPDDAGFIQRMQSMVTEMGDEAAANKWKNQAKFIEDSADPTVGWSDLGGYLDNIEGFYIP